MKDGSCETTRWRDIGEVYVGEIEGDAEIPVGIGSGRGSLNPTREREDVGFRE